jgi:hypothetical protein
MNYGGIVVLIFLYILQEERNYMLLMFESALQNWIVVCRVVSASLAAGLELNPGACGPMSNAGLEFNAGPATRTLDESSRSAKQASRPRFGIEPELDSSQQPFLSLPCFFHIDRDRPSWAAPASPIHRPGRCRCGLPHTPGRVLGLAHLTFSLSFSLFFSFFLFPFSVLFFFFFLFIFLLFKLEKFLFKKRQIWELRKFENCSNMKTV